MKGIAALIKKSLIQASLATENSRVDVASEPLGSAKEKYRSTAGIQQITVYEEMLSFQQSSVASDTQDLSPLHPIDVRSRPMNLLEEESQFQMEDGLMSSREVLPNQAI